MRINGEMARTRDRKTMDGKGKSSLCYLKYFAIPCEIPLAHKICKKKDFATLNLYKSTPQTTHILSTDYYSLRQTLVNPASPNEYHPAVKSSAGEKRKSEQSYSIPDIISKDKTEITENEILFLTQTIYNDIPADLVGSFWSFLIPDLENGRLAEAYNILVYQPSPFEDQISRDLPRTFPMLDYFKVTGGSGQDSLLNVMIAYSLFDREIGYCQGLSFIAGIFLLTMNAVDAFCLLVRVMHHYNLRINYRPGMEGLHLRLYQFGKILSKQLPTLSNHLERKGIHPMMFASQWFLTIFSYKFPLEIVFCVFDLFFMEGIESLFKVGIALLQKNEAVLLMLGFEELLEFLNYKLYYVYMECPRNLIVDASNIRITLKDLEELVKEWERIDLLDSLDNFKSKALVEENRNLKDVIRILEEENCFLQQQVKK